MMNIKHVMTGMALSLSLPLMAQWGGPQVQSTVINADNTVTFNYRSQTAKDVKVSVQFAGEKQMTKGDNDVWSVTVGPAKPDIYPYCFIVDGVNIMDASNPEWFPNETFKNSLLDMREGASKTQQVNEVAHGSVDYVDYYSELLGLYGRLVIYTPPHYDKNQNKKYPVFYLVSGTTDTEEVYFKVGRTNFILDNLIAEGKAEEMIVVMPYGNPSLYFPKGQAPRMMGDMFSKTLIDEIMPFVEKNYRTLNDKDHRAIGGFSRGGNQALANGLANLDKFSYLCSYSSFTMQQLTPEVYKNAADTNSKIKLFWLGVGTDDFLYQNAKEYMDLLDKSGIKNTKVFTDDKFGHTWMNARYFLEQSLPLLFK